MSSNYIPNQESIRMSLYQFLGGLIQLCPDREAAIAVMLEELTKISRQDPEDNGSDFYPDMIKPILKSTAYILTIKYNNLLNDANNTFGDNHPSPVKDTLDNNRQLIEMLNKYIDQL